MLNFDIRQLLLVMMYQSRLVDLGVTGRDNLKVTGDDNGRAGSTFMVDWTGSGLGVKKC